MAVLEFGAEKIPLEWYLNNASPKVLANHDHLSNILDIIDPRIATTKSTVDRIIPLTAEDMADLKQMAIIKPTETIESIRPKLGDSIYTGDSHWCYEVFGDFVDWVEVKKLNINLAVSLPNWHLLCLIRHREGADEFDYNLGWFHKIELNELRKLARNS